ncbi:MAG TPA: aminotransferase class III-fold pyridoxal phosphate-dependent enzyme, partial [Gemmatimonadaceae bacterium]|nr:aminotransferase class III-fold pyridoxal phosphate-dependent enzyme [Gemmatimonadaceae bacterium]
ERGRPEKDAVVALVPAYHGNTILALAASGREHYKAYFRPWLPEIARVPAPYAYRCPCGGRPPHCPACDGSALEETIVRLGAGRAAAFIAEPVGGSSTGASVAPAGYWRRVREICDRHEVLWIADEILCGAGRTGSWSALEPEGVVPDLMTLGKGIAGGFAPLAAVLAPRRIVDVLAAGSGALLHAQTFSHHAVSCAAGVATIRYLRAHRLIERCAATGARFHDRLRALLAYPHVGDVRGRGLLAGVEFADAGTRAPFPRAAKFAERFTEAALAAGLVVWPNVGHANGHDGDLVMLAPPFTISDGEIDELVARFGRALDAVATARAAPRASAMAT